MRATFAYLLLAAAGVAVSSTSQAQTPPMPPTSVVSQTSKLAWTPSIDDANVLSYRAELYLKSDVVVTSNGQLTVAVLPLVPSVTIDQGKPPIDATNTQTGPPLAPFLIPGLEYVAYVRAVAAPDNVSELSNGTEPFTLPPTQLNPCALHVITIAVLDWDRMVQLGLRGRVLVQYASPFPLVQLQIKMGAQVVGEQHGVDVDLRDSAGLYFSVPRVAGTYNFTVFAKDNAGCTAETTTPRSIIVF